MTDPHATPDTASLVDILGEAHGLPPSEREAFVRTACTNPALLAEALSLLGAMQRAGGFLSTPTMSPGASAMARLAPEPPGTMLGPYCILEQIGEGGFGVVYAAEQREPIRRRVAIKIIKPGMDTRAVVARFEQERQALALMDHPGIAHVLDAGSTPAGRPYFVMEHIKGRAITAFCDEHRLPVRERLALFAQVCDAVQHAHTKGVIHRDLKPGNILVTQADAGAPPRPVVIDFGVAKAMSARLTDKTLFTEQGLLLGTPEYMSPEQADRSEAEIDTRTDVYALGVILYELLTGALPFDPRALREAGYAAIQRIIREDEPPRPSTRLGSLGAEGVNAARARGANIGELTANLRAELEWIPLRAMRKAREDRYRSAAELGDDIANYLAHRPLIAGPVSAVYRARKFARRNTVGVVSAGLVLGALVLGMAGTAWGLVGAKRAERVASDERDRASMERDRATLVRDFLARTLGGVSPQVARGRDTALLGDLMDKATARIEAGEMTGNPDAERELRLVIAGVYADIGRFEDARRALPSEEGERGRPAAERARAFALRGELAISASRLEDAEVYLRGALAALDESPHENPRLRARVLTGLGTAASARRREDEAGTHFEHAISIARTLAPPDAELLASCLTMLARNVKVREEYDRAQDLYDEAVNLLETEAGRDSPALVAALSDRAILASQQREPDAALADLTRALSLAERIFPDPHPALAQAHLALGNQLMHAGKFKESAARFEACLAVQRRLYGDVSLPVEKTLHTLASIHIMSGEYERALAEESEADAAREKLLPPDARDARTEWCFIATCLRNLGRTREAVELMESHLPRCERVLAPESTEYLNALNELAACYYDDGRVQSAIDTARRVLRISTERRPDNPVFWLHEEQGFLGGLLLETGTRDNAVEAEAVLRDCLQARLLRFTEADWRVTMTRVSLGRAIAAQVCLPRTAGSPEPAPETTAFRMSRLQEAQSLIVPNFQRFLHNITKMQPSKARRPRVLGAARSLADMYDAWEVLEPGTGKSELAAHWRARRAELERELPDK